MTDRRLSILFLSSRLPYPVRDGHLRRTYNILSGLAARNDVHLLAMTDHPDQGGIGRNHLGRICTDLECLPAPSKRPGIPMAGRLLRSLASLKPYTLWRHYSREFAQRARELATSGRFDLVHCDILPIAYAVTQPAGIPVSLTDHDVCWIKSQRIGRASASPAFRLFSAVEWRKLRRYEADVFSRVSLGIAVSGTDRRALAELCPGARLAVVENGVDTQEFLPGPGPRDERSLVWVGGFGYKPNRDAVHWFLDSIYPLIRRELPQVSFTIVGADPTDLVRRHAAADPSIRVAGFVNDPVPFLQQATVFVAPIRSGSGTRLKTLEAMAAEKAIVTTTIGCEGIEGLDKKHWLAADDPRDFAMSVVYLMKNGVLRRRLGENARRLAVERYDWKTITGKLDGLYRELCGKG